MVYAPLTWWAAETFWLHANVGADQDATGRRTRRLGVSGEWAASDRLSVIAERIVVTGDWTSRLGTRLTLTDSINVDLSVVRIGPNATRQWVIGLNQVLAR